MSEELVGGRPAFVGLAQEDLAALIAALVEQVAERAAEILETRLTKGPA